MLCHWKEPIDLDYKGVFGTSEDSAGVFCMLHRLHPSKKAMETFVHNYLVSVIVGQDVGQFEVEMVEYSCFTLLSTL